LPGQASLRSVKASLIVALSLIAPSATAGPQANAGLTIGGGAFEVRDQPKAFFQLGARADVLFLRKRNRDMAVGPYVDFVTAAFETLELGGGVEWLVPLSESLPLVLSAGAFERRAPGYAWEPGAVSTIFIGSRSYNFSSWYGLAAGFFVQGRWGFGDAHQADILGGLQVDLSLFAYPFLLAYEALRH
jgi:hypothetical protein